MISSLPIGLMLEKALYDYKDMVLAPYSEYWRQMKGICVSQLLCPKRVQSFRPIREEEANLLVKKIEQSCSGSSPIDLSTMFASFANDVLLSAAFGRKYSGRDGAKKLKKLLEEFVGLLGTFNIADFIPWLGWLNYFNGLNARVEKVFKELDAVIYQILEHHMARKEMDVTEDRMDFVDVLLEIQRNGTESMSRDNIEALILDMFAGGNDTTQTTLQWTRTELSSSPKSHETCTRGDQKDHRKQTASDGGGLAQNDLLESRHQRIHEIASTNSFDHSSGTNRDVKVQGYDISAKTSVVVISAWAIGRDPATWEDPEEFKPERFLDSPIDFKGNDMHLIPFGSGRRGCPGTTFAAATIENALASILHKFEWGLPGGAKPEELDVSEASGLTIHRKFSLVAIATPHSF